MRTCRQSGQTEHRMAVRIGTGKPCVFFPGAPPGRSASIRLHPRLDRILDVLDLVELDIDDLAVDLLNAADVDGLDDVARLRIDRDRPARAFPGHALDRSDEGFAVGV